MIKIKEKLNLLNPRIILGIKKRKEICTSCPFNSKNAVEKGIYKTKRLDLHCMHCGCNIDLYTKCLDCTCSIKEFNEKNNTNIEVKWKPLI